MASLSNINRLLRVYRDLYCLVFDSGCPDDYRSSLSSVYVSVRETLLECLAQAGTHISFDK